MSSVVIISNYNIAFDSNGVFHRENLTEAQAQAIVELGAGVGALVGGLGGSGIAGASIGATIGTNAVENNDVSNDPRMNVAYGDPMVWSQQWKNTAKMLGGAAAYVEAMKISKAWKPLKGVEKGLVYMGAFSLYQAHAFEHQATGKWDKTGIVTDIITGITKISNNPFTEFVFDESIGNAVDGARGK